MQINVECEYCNSVYDYKTHSSCPNCGAAPNKEKLSAAKKRADSEKAAEINAKGAPTGRFMTFLIKCIPLWIVLIVGLAFLPDAVENQMMKKAVSSIQTVDELTFDEHGMNEKFIFDDVITLDIDEAYFAESEVIDAILSEDMRLLVLHINAVTDDPNKVENNYYSLPVYITNGEYCRAAVSSFAISSCPEAFAHNTLSLSSMRYSTVTDGYLCFIVGKDETDFSFCIEENHFENGALQLEKVHKIGITVSEEDSV